MLRESPHFQVALERSTHETLLGAYKLGKSLRWYLNVLSIGLSLLESNDIIDSSILTKAIRIVDPTFRMNLLKTVSVRELVLLIAMVCCEALEQQYYTFEMIFEKYSAHCRLHGINSSLRIGRVDAIKSFEHLEALNLIETVGNAYKIGGNFVDSGAILPAEYRPIRITIEPGHLLKAIQDGSVHCPTSIRQWALRVQI